MPRADAAPVTTAVRARQQRIRGHDVRSPRAAGPGDRRTHPGAGRQIRALRTVSHCALIRSPARRWPERARRCRPGGRGEVGAKPRSCPERQRQHPVVSSSLPRSPPQVVRQPVRDVDAVGPPAGALQHVRMGADDRGGAGRGELVGQLLLVGVRAPFVSVPQCRNTTTVDPFAAAALTFSISIGSNAFAMPVTSHRPKRFSRCGRAPGWPRRSRHPPVDVRCSGAYAAAAFAPNRQPGTRRRRSLQLS